MSFLVVGKSSRPRQSGRACHRCGKRHAGSHRRRSRALKKALVPLGPRPMDLLGESQQEQTQPKGWWHRGAPPAGPDVPSVASKATSPEPRVALAPASALRAIAARMPIIRRFLPKRSG